MTPPKFDHEKLLAHQQALHFVVWAGPWIEKLPAKIAARDQLDRASTSIPLNLAEGNGKRHHADRCRYLDIARGSGVECAACLDVLVARGFMSSTDAAAGKAILLHVISLISGLIARFSGQVHEDAANYGSELVEKENE